MGSFRCPYLVRHGKFDKTTGTVNFEDHCALKIKAESPPPQKNKVKTPPPPGESPKISCKKHPLPSADTYMKCETYKESFQQQEEKRDVIPTRDTEYTGGIKSSSLLDLEML